MGHGVNPSKCQVVRVTPETQLIICIKLSTTWTSPGGCHQCQVFGVDISNVLSWNSHIDRITGNMNHTLGFIRRNIRTKMLKVRETAYYTLVRPELEYASPIWDPFSKNKILQIEKIQRRAARWTTSGFRLLALGKVLQRCWKNLADDLSNRD